MKRVLVAACALVTVGWPVGALGQDRFFNSAGVQIRYVEHGSGEPVVLVHGYTNDIEQGWVENGVLEDLARDYRVIALDLRAHGRSGKPHDPGQYGQQVSQDIARLLDHLGIPRAHIIGYSYGGVIVAKLLTTNPDRFASAVIGGAAGRRNWTDQNARDAEAEASELERGLPYRSLILRTWPTDEPPPSEEVVRERSRVYVMRSDPLAHAAMLRARGGEAVTDAQMAAVRVPTLAIVGTADPALERVRSLKASWPALDVVVIEGATHWGVRGATRRPEFVQAIRSFLATHRLTEPQSR